MTETEYMDLNKSNCELTILIEDNKIIEVYMIHLPKSNRKIRQIKILDKNNRVIAKSTTKFKTIMYEEDE